MSLESELLQKAQEWRRLAEAADDSAARQALIRLAEDYEATAALQARQRSAGPARSAAGDDLAAEPDGWSETSALLESEEADAAALRDALVEDLRAVALPTVRSNPTGAAALMALATVAGDVIAAVATSPEHLEEGLRIFARLTREEASKRPLGRK